MKKLLFITWDGPQTSYMEGLFMPIFQEVKRQNPHWNFHVLQFTWGDEQRIQETQKVAKQLGIQYQSLPITRKPIASLGSFISLFQGASKIEKYIRQHQIDVLMPRSTFPAYMVNQLKGFKGKIIFDADGLPIEERIDFAGLKRSSLVYKWMKAAETKMLKKADAVITRSQKAIEIHVENIGEENRHKFSVIFNGRDKEKFSLHPEYRKEARGKLSLNDEFLFIYAGSLGPQYCLPEMLEIFKKKTEYQESRFLILTGNTSFATENIPTELASKIIIKSVPSDEVPFYLNAADCSFALRQPTHSMQGVAPVKLGEYLLCGLPVIASKGIGDTEEILKYFGECYLYDHNLDSKENLYNVQEYIKNCIFKDSNKIREKALQHFSLEAAALSYLNAINSL